MNPHRPPGQNQFPDLTRGDPSFGVPEGQFGAVTVDAKSSIWSTFGEACETIITAYTNDGIPGFVIDSDGDVVHCEPRC